MTIAEKYKAEHVIIPLLRANSMTIHDVSNEIAYRKTHINSCENVQLKIYTLDELIGAETMWNKV